MYQDVKFVLMNLKVHAHSINLEKLYYICLLPKIETVDKF